MIPIAELVPYIIAALLVSVWLIARDQRHFSNGNEQTWNEIEKAKKKED